MNKYLRAVSYNLVFFLVSVVFFLIVTPLAIRVMGEEFFGLWSILSALILFSNIGTLGISAIVMKFSSEAPPDGDTESQANRVMTAGFMIVCSMALLSAVILLSTKDLIVKNIHTSADLKYQFSISLSIIVAGIFPQFLTRVPHGFLLARLRNREARQLELLASILLWLGAVLWAYISRNLIIVAVWCVISNLMILFLYLKTTYRIFPLRLSLSLSTLKKMLNFSGYMFIENLAIAAFQQMDRVIVGVTLGPALAGVYSVGTSLALRLSLVTGQTTEVMIPYASLKESTGDQARLYLVFRRLSRYVSLLMAGLSTILIIWMQEIISLWISPDYAARYANAFRLLVVAYGWLSLSRPAHQTLTGLGRVKFTSSVYLISTLTMLAGLILFSSRFGLIGAAISNLLMIFLLAFNVFVYYIFQNFMHWRNALADLRWGLFLPILLYGLNLSLPQSNLMIYKLSETVLLGILFVWLIQKDNLVKDRLLQIKQLILQTRT